MVFNPVTMTWEGNESDVKHFPSDRANHEKDHGNARKKPALISNLAVCEVKYQNNMIFDPNSGKWVGNEDETADWDFLEETDENKIKSPVLAKNCAISGKK